MSASHLSTEPRLPRTLFPTEDPMYSWPKIFRPLPRKTRKIPFKAPLNPAPKKFFLPDWWDRHACQEAENHIARDGGRCSGCFGMNFGEFDITPPTINLFPLVSLRPPHPLF